MDAQTGTPLTPLYSREPPAAAAENPSAASVGAATAGAPPTVGLARSLFLPPRMTTPTGGVAPKPSRAAAVPSRAAAVGLKKGKNNRQEEGGGRFQELVDEEEAWDAWVHLRPPSDAWVALEHPPTLWPPWEA
ncbi:hypothetical protein D1007_42676 [Hordeum vulgare]|nr:hypothetical protein D1007_42676 [Hordeum vulgare]